MSIMTEYFFPYEKELFFYINGSHNYFTDCVMWLFSGSTIWIPIVCFLLCILIYKKKWTAWLPLLIAIGLLFLCCDQFSSGLVKPLFSRYRPTHYPGIMDMVRTLYNYTGGQYGFISGHATNAFGFAMFTSLLFHNKAYRIVVFIWASTMSYSRVYLGVHFISDVVAGAITGMIIGYLIFILYRFATQQITGKRCIETRSGYSRKRVTFMSVVIVSYIFLFSVFSQQLIPFLHHVKAW